MATVTVAEVPANHKNDTKNFSDIYVKRFDPLTPSNGFLFFKRFTKWSAAQQKQKNTTHVVEFALR